MGVWDEVFAPAIRGVTNTAIHAGAQKKKRDRVGKMLASSEVIKPMMEARNAKSFLSKALDEVGGIFHAPGVIGKAAADSVASIAYPNEAEPFQKLLEQAPSGFSVMQHLFPDGQVGYSTPTYMPGDAAQKHPMRLVGRSMVEASPEDKAAYRSEFSRLWRGYDPATDGNMDAIAGSRIAYPRAMAQAEANRGSVPEDRTLASRVPGVGFAFDRNTPSLASAGIASGMSPGDAALMSMLNPLEWPGQAEKGINWTLKGVSKVGKLAEGTRLATELPRAGRAVSGLAKAAEVASNPGLSFLENAPSLAKKVMNWKIPGLSKKPISADEIRRLSGLSEEEVARLLGKNGSAATSVPEPPPVASESSDWRALLEDAGKEPAPLPASSTPSAPPEPVLEQPGASSVPVSEVPPEVYSPQAPLPNASVKQFFSPVTAQEQADLAASRAAEAASYDAGQRLVEDAAASYNPRRSDWLAEVLDQAPKEVSPVGQAAEGVPGGQRAAVPGEVGNPAGVPGVAGDGVDGAAQVSVPASPEVGLVDPQPTPGPSSPQPVEGSWRQLLDAPSWRSIRDGEALPSVAHAEPAPPPALDVSVQRRLSDPGSGYVRLSSNPVDLALSGLAKAFDFTTDAVTNVIGAPILKANTAINARIKAMVDGSKTMKGLSKSLERVFSRDYGVEGATVEAANNFVAQSHAVTRGATEDVMARLHAGMSPEQRRLAQQYMLDSIDESFARQTLGDDLTDAVDVVRALVTTSGADYLSEALKLEKQVLLDSNRQQLQLIDQFLKTTGKKAVTIGEDSRTGELIKLTRDQVRNEALKAHTAKFVSDTEAMVDKAWASLEAEGLVKDGRVVDQGLDLGVWAQNKGRYLPRQYMAYEYGVDLHDPHFAKKVIDAYKERTLSMAAEANKARVAHGLPAMPVPDPMPSDLENFILGNMTGEWSPQVARAAGKFYARKDLSQGLKEFLAPMVNPAAGAVKALEQLRVNTALLKTRRWVRSHSNYVSRPGETLDQFVARSGFPKEDIVFDYAESPLVNSGALTGHYIHRDAADLLQMTRVLPALHSPDALDKVKSLMRGVLSLSHVILAPAAGTHQIVQNGFSMFTELGARGLGDYFNAFRSVISRDADYMAARDAGILSAGHDEGIFAKMDIGKYPEFEMSAAEWSLAEIGRGSRYVEGIANAAIGAIKAGKRATQSLIDKGAAYFSLSDDAAKIAAFKHFRRKGLSVNAARDEALGLVYSGTGRSRYERFSAGMSTRQTTHHYGTKNKAFLAADATSFLLSQPYIGASQYAMKQVARAALGIKSGKGVWAPLTDPGKMMRFYTMILGAYGMQKLGQRLNGVDSQKEAESRNLYSQPLLPSSMMAPPSLTNMVQGDGYNGWVDFGAFTSWAQPASGRYSVAEHRNTDLFDNVLSTFVPGAGAMRRVAGEHSGDTGITPFVKMAMELPKMQDIDSGESLLMNEDAPIRDRVGHVYRTFMPGWAPNPLGAMEVFNESYQENPDYWRAAVRGIAKESPGLASRLVAGLQNSIDYQFADPEYIRRAGEITDYRGKVTYLAKALIGMAGLRIDTRLNGTSPTPQFNKKTRQWEMKIVNEALSSLEAAKTAKIAAMKQHFEKVNAQRTGEDYARRKRRLEATIKDIKAGKPHPSFFETTLDTWLNVGNAAAKTAPAELLGEYSDSTS